MMIKRISSKLSQILLILQAWILFSSSSLADSSTRFLILGDTGTGDEGQTRVAQAMEKVCASRGCQFALLAGDNFYPKGVRGVKDPQFQTKFEKPYENLKFPFFFALGNHDQSGKRAGSGVYPEFGQYEVDYTKFSGKWKMPDRYYSMTAPFSSPEDPLVRNPSPLVEVFVLDTNPLAPLATPVYEWYLPKKAYDLKQRSWLRKSIETSKAPWKFVMGHHPYRSNGRHGNAGQFRGSGLIQGEELKLMYEAEVCGKVDLLLTGHDHSLQWLRPHGACGSRPEFIVSGAGAKYSGACSPLPECHQNDAFWENFQNLGFFWAEASEKQLKIVAYIVEGGVPKVAFERTLFK